MTGAIVGLPWGWRNIACTRCHHNTAVFEIPAGYLNDPEFQPYVCGPCLEKGTAG